MFGDKLDWGQLHFPFSGAFLSLRFYTENRHANKNAEIYRGGESSIGLTSKALFNSRAWLDKATWT